MLIYFKVQNYKSILEPVMLDFRAMEDDSSFPNSIIEEAGIRCNAINIIYGPNGSGKSSILDALKTMQRIITSKNVNEVTVYQNKKANNDFPTIFELCLEEMGKIGKVQIIFTGGYYLLQIYSFNDGNWIELLPKDSQINKSIKTSHFKYQSHENEHRPSFAQMALSIMYSIYFYDSIDNQLDPMDNTSLPNTLSQRVLQKPAVNSMSFVGKLSSIEAKKSSFIYYLKYLMDDIETVEFICEDLDIKYGINPNFTYNIYTATPKRIVYKQYSIDIEEESAGTKRILKIAHLLTLGKYSYTGTVVIDEIDAGLHDTLATKIIEIFNENRKEARQLIFTTHNTNLLNEAPCRRDQIWFTEMDENRTTKLYSLADIEPKATADFRRKYLSGKYGALPKNVCNEE